MSKSKTKSKPKPKPEKEIRLPTKHQIKIDRLKVLSSYLYERYEQTCTFYFRDDQIRQDKIEKEIQILKDIINLISCEMLDIIDKKGKWKYVRN